MSNFEIQEFESHYLTQIQSLLKDIFVKLGFGFDLEAKDSDLKDILKNYVVDYGRFWLLVENKKIIGTIALKPFRNDCYELKRFFISEKYRGKGYGNKALQYIINYAKEKKIKSIKLDTNSKLVSAIYLYKKYGFSEIESYRDAYKKDMKWFELKL